MFHVLMSTYNGENYLEQQLASIFEQRDAGELFLHVRDDGSCDSTLAILKKYQQQGYPLSIYQGENVGPAGSFWELVREIDIEPGDHAAFADQDDVWMPDKLKRALQAIAEVAGADAISASVPVVYCANVERVDTQLASLGKEHETPPQVTLQAQLTCGIAPGCSMVMNDAMMKVLKQVDFPVMPMHDTMVLLTGFCIGRVIYEQEPVLYYRQHESNAEAMAGNSFLRRRKKMLKRWFGSSQHSLDKVAAELLEVYGTGTYGELREGAAETLALAASYKKSVGNRWKLLWDKAFTSANKKAFWSFKIRVLLGLA